MATFGSRWHPKIWYWRLATFWATVTWLLATILGVLGGFLLVFRPTVAKSFNLPYEDGLSNGGITTTIKHAIKLTIKLKT